LHSSVLKRFAAKDGVQHYFETAPYRPKNLSGHLKLILLRRDVAERMSGGHVYASP
jgi:hypothetical protein